VNHESGLRTRRALCPAVLALLLLVAPALAGDADRRLVSRLASTPADRLQILRQLDPASRDPRLPALLKAVFEDSETEVKLWAARHLHARGDDQALAWLVTQRREGDRWVYDHASKSLGLYARPANLGLVVGALVQARKPWGPEVVALLGGVLRVGGQADRDVALEAVRSSPPSERIRLWRLLAKGTKPQVPGERLASFMVGALEGAELTEHALGVQALLGSAGEEGARAVAAWLSETDSPRRWATLNVIRATPSRSAQAALAHAIRLADAPRPQLKALAAKLGAHATPRLLVDLALSGHQEAATRHLPAKFLARRPEPEDWRALQGLIAGEDELRALAYRIAACRKHEVSAQTLLLVGATDPVPSTRARAQDALGSCGMLDPRALRRALPLLLRAGARSEELLGRVSKTRSELVAYVFLEAIERQERVPRQELLRLAKTLRVVPQGAGQSEAIESLRASLQNLR